MRIKMGSSILFFVSVFAFIGLPSPLLALDKEGSEAKVAVVNGTVIVRKDLDRQMGFLQQKMQDEGESVKDADLAQMERNALENLISEELLYQEALKQKTNIGDPEISESFNKIKARFSNEEEFKNTLSKAGLNQEVLKSQLKKSLTIDRFIEKEFVQKVSISDKESKDYYDGHPDLFRRPEQIRASHILIRIDAKADKSGKESSRNKLEGIRQRVKKGEDFAELAKQNSEDSTSANGGDLGYFQRGRMVKPFEDAAFALKPGEVSDIVESPYGYHLIKVTEKKPESAVAYEDVKERLQAYLKQERIQEQVGSYVAEQKGKAKVERMLKEEPR